MNLLAFNSLLTMVFALFLGSFVYSKNPKHSVNRLFLLSSLGLTYWGFIEFCFRQAETFEYAAWWLKAGSFWVFPIVFLNHFILEYVEVEKKTIKKFLYSLYIPAGIITVIQLTTNIFKTVPVRESWGWSYGIPEITLSNLLVTIWGINIAFLSSYLCFRYYSKQTDYLTKQQAKLILIGIPIAEIIGFISGLVSPYFQIPKLITLTYFWGLIVISYAILKYQLFMLTPTIAAETILATDSDYIILVTPEGIIQQVNEATFNTLEYEKHDLIGYPLKKVFGSVYSETEILQKSEMEYPSSSDNKTTLKTKTGKLIPISLSMSFIYEATGAVRGIIYLAKDISEQMRQEVAIHEDLDRLKTILDSINAGVAVIDAETHAIADVNPAALEMIGAPKEQVINSICHNYICPAEKGHCPITDLKQNVDKSERVLLTANGMIIPILKSVVSVTLNNRKHLIEIFIDITDRKQTEAALQQSEERYRTLINTIGEGIWVTNHNGVTILVNPALEKMLG
ncbi:MAG: PAS domain S-box protein, partial [Candidatus Hodarchaeota archaeon]